MQLEAIKNIIIKVLGGVLYKIININFSNPIILLIGNSLIASISLFISVQLRIGIDFFSFSYFLLFNSILVFGLVSASVFMWLRINNQSLDYYNINKLLLAILVINILYIPLMYLMNWNSNLPLSIVIINILVMIVLLIGTRYIYYIFFKPKNYTLIIGNRSSISVFINAYSNVINSSSPISFGSLRDQIAFGSLRDPILFGIINTNPDTPIVTKSNIPVIGNINDLNYIISQINVSQVIITDNDLSIDNKELLFLLSQQYKFLILQTGMRIE